MKTVVFDIDGTLSFDGQQIAPVIVAAIQAAQAQGQRVIFASARPIRDLWPIVPAFRHCLLIGANGALVGQGQQRTVIAPIAPADWQVLRALLARERVAYVVDGAWDYAAQLAPQHPLWRQLDPGRLARQRPLDEIEQPVKVLLLGLSSSQLERLDTELRTSTGLMIVRHTGEGTLDLTAGPVNKYQTLRGLGVQDYLAFENDQNDTQLLQHAQTAVWVTSKPDLPSPVRTAYLCAPESEAVAAWIRRLASPDQA